MIASAPTEHEAIDAHRPTIGPSRRTRPVSTGLPTTRGAPRLSCVVVRASAPSGSVSFAAVVSFALLVSPACGRRPCVDPALEPGPSARLDRALGTCNAVPEAAIEPLRVVRKRTRVELDGRASADANGDALTYRWRVATGPRTSTATIAAPDAAITHFTPDRGGNYGIELVVSDGELESPPRLVTLIANNARPQSFAGADFLAPLGQPARLDGSASRDADGDVLAYRWRILAQPPASVAELVGADTPTPTIIPDVRGVYTLGLVVDDGDSESPEDEVRVGGGITGGPPIADAGAATTGVLGLWGPLDGSASRDPEGDPLTYRWTVQAVPPGSLAQAEFDPPDAARTRFRPAKEGRYTLALVVDDGFFSSAPATVEVDVRIGDGVIGGPCEPSGCPQFSICRQGTCVARGGCGQRSAAGGDAPESIVVELGATQGTFEFTYDTYSVEDQMTVFYEGRSIFTTGCVGDAGIERITFMGNASEVRIDVRPNCARGGSGTAWEFTVGCPM
jgi:hypothetical protein